MLEPCLLQPCFHAAGSPGASAAVAREELPRGRNRHLARKRNKEEKGSAPKRGRHSTICLSTACMCAVAA